LKEKSTNGSLYLKEKSTLTTGWRVAFFWFD